VRYFIPEKFASNTDELYGDNDSLGMALLRTLVFTGLSRSETGHDELYFDASTVKKRQTRGRGGIAHLRVHPLNLIFVRMNWFAVQPISNKEASIHIGHELDCILSEDIRIDTVAAIIWT
jgi:hypothetical protein